MEQPGRILARGVCRHLIELGMTPLTEFVPARGLRVDVIALGPKGEIWVVECKSSRADFAADHKWQGYLPYCDRFYWAVDSAFPSELLPLDTGLMLADAYGAEVAREAPEHKLVAARRTALTRKLARTSTARLQALMDPGLPQMMGELAQPAGA
ncbi:MAG: MmcB family DNA repair protein [Pseudomonadota bacterium]